MKGFDIGFSLRLFPVMLKYLKVTLALSFGAAIFGLALAIIISIILDLEVKILTPIIKVYISFFRGTPLIAQLFLIYFGFVQIFPSFKNLSSFAAALIVMSLNSSSFMAETIRGAISSVDVGQLEAAYSVGMTYGQAMAKIILPQATRVAIPALFNSFINIVKNSSIAFTIGVTEMIASAQLEAASSYRYLEAFTNIAIVFWILTSILGWMQKRLEYKFSQSI